jgi:hypothetical protein
MSWIAGPMATPAVLAQSAVDPTGGGLIAILITLGLAWLFYAITLHLAAVFFVGEVPTQPAVVAALVPAATSLLLQQWGPAVVIPVTLLGDFLAVRYSYGLPGRSAVVLTLLHFAFAAALIVPLNNLFGFV